MYASRTNTAQVPSPRFGVPTGVLIIWIATLAGADPIEKTTTKGPVEVSVQLAPTAPVIGDPVTLSLVAVPLQLLYELSTLIAWIMARRQAEEEADFDAGDD